MFSKFFIDRPIFSTVLAIVIMIAGGAAFTGLPVEQYPKIVPPEVEVQATYAGADAATIAESVAAPLEQAINGVDDMLYMTSGSSDAGTMNLSVTFATGTDPDQAAIDVNNRVQRALPQLPQEVRDQGVVVNKKSSALLMVITLLSENEQFDTKFLSNYGLINIIDSLKRVDGIGDARLFGAQDYSIRVWFDPAKLAHFGLTQDDVATAIREQNAQFAAGKFNAAPNKKGEAFTYTISAEGRFSEVSEFENIILAAGGDGGTLRLKDVARVELGTKTYGFNATYNGKPTVPMGLYLAPGANALETVDQVREQMKQLAERFPGDMDYRIPLDTTDFVRISIKEVLKTFLEALLLVVLVIFVFLQKPRATIVPLVAIPVALIGALAGLFMSGMSINLLTLFGFVLAIGIVVDDAIIVIENVERLMREEKLNARDASIKAMEQVTGPIVATTLVLLAVFVPVAFIPGLAGEMYRQFAVALSISVVLSGVVALTLTPSMTALLLKNHKEKEPSLPFRLFNRGFDAFRDGYMKLVNFFLVAWPIGLLVFAGVVVAAVVMLRSTPTGLVPEEDPGYFISAINLDPAASLERTGEVRDEYSRLVRQNPDVHMQVAFAGYDLLAGTQRSYKGVTFTRLKDWSERPDDDQSVQAAVGKAMGAGAQIEEGFIMSFVPPPIRGMSTTGGFEAYLQQRGSADVKALAQATNALVAAANQRPELAGVRTTFVDNTPQFRIDVDREEAYALDIPVAAIFRTMQGTFGTRYVNDFTLFGRNFQVNLAAEADHRANPEDLEQVFVRGGNQELVPISSVVSLTRTTGADVINRFNIFPAAKIMGQPAPGYSSGQALEAMQAVVDETLGGGDYTIGWVGSAFQELSSGSAGSIAFLLGVIMVFLILAAQYERWSLPFAVITAVPFAVLGALIAIWMRDLNIDIYFQVGLLVLIAMSAKNAILVVEFASKMHTQDGLSIKEAALKAARIRFRPVIMTSMAFILGVLPLAIATGAGEAARHSLGTPIVGGMILATYVAILFIPMFFELLQTGSEKLFGNRRKKTDA
ncbi:multidrug efflux RND transporter permease subunit [Guyparkeria hydrothermalis]|uniref:efflux RND transporter permease subunit n=1 Tax=Guyparkeria hydrothermalis TaxID=923 RepID=UPI0020223EB9|nr:multidrug efflux RND transporter permease subunit [Guyparkeria hydrothermalis]MCL7743933.1 multidrug efflux RND transporter permease subunit [Guyparkeria hydrothermalis]